MIENINPLKTQPYVSISVTKKESLESMVGVHLLSDLNGQLEDVVQNMEQELAAKQNLREEILQLQKFPEEINAMEIEGKRFYDLNETQFSMLDHPETAIPLSESDAAKNIYRLSEGNFLKAIDLSISRRKETLAQKNSQGELTMIEIQSLVEQRKQALTMLSNLLSSSHQIAQTIIGNIKN